MFKSCSDGRDLPAWILVLHYRKIISTRVVYLSLQNIVEIHFDNHIVHNNTREQHNAPRGTEFNMSKLVSI